MNRKWTDEDLINAVNNPEILSLAGVMKELGLVPKGGTYKTVQKYVKLLGLDISHFTGQSHLKGKHHNWAKTISLEDILKVDVDYPSNTLKKRLLKSGHFEHKCYKCNRTTWNETPIPIELEHINGINTDNRIVNLTLLCPNCHAQTPTYRGRNIKRRSEEYHCIDCNCKISRTSKRCKSCTGKVQKRKVPDRPSREVLLKKVSEIGYCATGRKYGVSDNAIRKWLKF